jgi:hypothetical protein
VRWEFRLGPLKGRRFVGGYFSSSADSLPARQEGKTVVFGSADPFRLGAARGTFFGLEESIFRAVVQSVRVVQSEVRDIPTFEGLEPFYSGVSILRDGSVLAPLDFFAAVDTQQY